MMSMRWSFAGGALAAVKPTCVRRQDGHLSILKRLNVPVRKANATAFISHLASEVKHIMSVAPTANGMQRYGSNIHTV